MYMPIIPPTPNNAPSSKSGVVLELKEYTIAAIIEFIQVENSAAPDTKNTGRPKTEIQNGAIIAPPPIPYAVPIMPTTKEVIPNKRGEYLYTLLFAVYILHSNIPAFSFFIDTIPSFWVFPCCILVKPSCAVFIPKIPRIHPTNILNLVGSNKSFVLT